MEKQILDIYNSLQELAWYFGDHGINDKCCEDLSFIEFMALKRVYENTDISIQEIGINLNITKSGATKIINRLERKGYVIRKNSPIDGRVCCVGMTEAGVRIISKIMAKYTDHIKAILVEMEPSTIQAIKTALKTLSDSTDRYNKKKLRLEIDIMKKIKIYEPAMCCPTGLCGVSIDPELLRISTLQNTLKKNGVDFQRFNLSNSPQEFINNKEVNKFINENGVEKLPLTVIDEEIVITGRYPTDEEISKLLDITIEQPKSADQPKRAKIKSKRTGGCGCSGGNCC